MRTSHFGEEILVETSVWPPGIFSIHFGAKGTVGPGQERKSDAIPFHSSVLLRQLISSFQELPDTPRHTNDSTL